MVVHFVPGPRVTTKGRRTRLLLSFFRDAVSSRSVHQEEHVVGSGLHDGDGFAANLDAFIRR